MAVNSIKLLVPNKNYKSRLYNLKKEECFIFYKLNTFYRDLKQNYAYFLIIEINGLINRYVGQKNVKSLWISFTYAK